MTTYISGYNPEFAIFTAAGTISLAPAGILAIVVPAPVVVPPIFPDMGATGGYSSGGDRSAYDDRHVVDYGQRARARRMRLKRKLEQLENTEA